MEISDRPLSPGGFWRRFFVILVTVGTHTQGFRRLIEATDDLAARGVIREPVEAQIGCTDYEPRVLSWSRSFPYDEFYRKVAAARLVITHAGAGIIILCRREGKRMIVAPRQKKFGEHTNDHQLELAREIEEQGLAPVVYDMDDLPRALKEAAGNNPAKKDCRDLPAARIIDSFLSRVAPSGRDAG